MSLAPRIDRLERQLVLNGGFDVWARATSFVYAGTNEFGPDRWWLSAQVSDTFDQAIYDDAMGRYALRMTSVTGGGNMSITQSLESRESYRLAGKTITISAWLKRNSTHTGTAQLIVLSGTGIDEKFLSTGAVTETKDIDNADLSDSTFTRHDFTVTIPANATQCGFSVKMVSPVAGSQLDVRNVMVNVGEQAGDFRTMGVSTRDEAFLCKRFFFNPEARELFGAGFWPSSGIARGSFNFPIRMRKAPTVNLLTPASMIVSRRGTSNASAGTLAVQTVGVGGIDLDYSTVTGLSNAGDGAVMFNNNVNAITFDAELT